MKKPILALLMTIASLGGAHAQSRAALTQDRDEPGRNPYYAQGSCTQVTFSFCSVVFPAVPAGKRLIVTYVSALNLMPAPNTITSIDLRVQNGSITSFLKPVVNPGTSPTANYTVSEPVFNVFEAGQAAQLLTFVNSNVNFQMVGIITGYMIDVP